MCVLATAFHHDDMVTEVGLYKWGENWLIHARWWEQKRCVLEGTLRAE